MMSVIHDRDPLRGRKPKRVLVVDDSPIMRSWLGITLDADPRLQVIGQAADAFEAREMIKASNPDVVTLDIEMPHMSGMDFLDRIMRLRPLPVVIISGLTKQVPKLAKQAFSLGAADFISKPTSANTVDTADDLRARVFNAACQVPSAVAPVQGAERAAQSGQSQPLILIGASTGGVTALNTMLPHLSAQGAPVVVAQHMPSPYLLSFTRQLNQKLPQDVRLASAGEPLLPGMIRFAPADKSHTLVHLRNGVWHCRMEEETGQAAYIPSVDRLFASATPSADRVIAVILTGLGRDGTQGMVSLADAGATTFGQDRDSSVVYGMPKAAWEAGAVQVQKDISEIGVCVQAAASVLHQKINKRHR